MSEDFWVYSCQIYDGKQKPTVVKKQGVQNQTKSESEIEKERKKNITFALKTKQKCLKNILTIFDNISNKQIKNIFKLNSYKSIWLI